MTARMPEVGRSSGLTDEQEEIITSVIRTDFIGNGIYCSHCSFSTPGSQSRKMRSSMHRTISDQAIHPDRKPGILTKRDWTQLGQQ